MDLSLGQGDFSFDLVCSNQWAGPIRASYLRHPRSKRFNFESKLPIAFIIVITIILLLLLPTSLDHHLPIIIIRKLSNARVQKTTTSVRVRGRYDERERTVLTKGQAFAKRYKGSVLVRNIAGVQGEINFLLATFPEDRIDRSKAQPSLRP